MAKCIRVVGQGTPVRLSDDNAFQVVVRDHDGEYCSKTLFKREAEARGAPMIARLVNGKITETATLHRNLQHGKRSHA